jgi:hypothetical protein
MKNKIILTLLCFTFTFIAFGQKSAKMANPSYVYNTNPGFVNTTEIHGAIGLGDTAYINTEYYYGFTNVFGYQIDRNFVIGLGVGYFHYETLQHIPLYLEFKYCTYLKRVTPFIFADGGYLVDPVDFRDGSKIFINPGIGINRSLSPKLEGSLSAGLTIQMGDNLPRVSFINIKLGIVFRKNIFRLFKQE